MKPLLLLTGAKKRHSSIHPFAFQAQYLHRQNNYVEQQTTGRWKWVADDYYNPSEPSKTYLDFASFTINSELVYPDQGETSYFRMLSNSSSNISATVTPHPAYSLDKRGDDGFRIIFKWQPFYGPDTGGTVDRFQTTLLKLSRVSDNFPLATLVYERLWEGVGQYWVEMVDGDGNIHKLVGSLTGNESENDNDPVTIIVDIKGNWIDLNVNGVHSPLIVPKKYTDHGATKATLFIQNTSGNPYPFEAHLYDLIFTSIPTIPEE